MRYHVSCSGVAATVMPSFGKGSAAELRRSLALGVKEKTMAFIDWSDSEGMFDLLIEFIRDEMNDSPGDPDRQQFLGYLLTKVSASNECTVADAIKKLTAIQSSIDEEFKTDPVVLHITDFINELKRIR
jgi:hypothetical protein